MVILCFERQYPKQNSVIHVTSKSLPEKSFSHPKVFGWLRYCYLSALPPVVSFKLTVFGYDCIIANFAKAFF